MTFDWSVDLISLGLLVGWWLLDWRRAKAWMLWLLMTYKKGPPHG
jgi:hypothetical protein